jgi:hypothetical protein
MTTQLAAPLHTLTTLATTYGGKTAQRAITTFQQQPAMSQGIRAWWHWVTHELAQQTQETEVQNWVLLALLPWLYWSQQAQKTRRASLKARYQQAASAAFDQLIAAPLTLQLSDADLQGWVQWGQWMCRKYQRTSSAIEGRNGYLALHHHAARGFSEYSWRVLTIVHNFDLKRPVRAACRRLRDNCRTTALQASLSRPLRVRAQYLHGTTQATTVCSVTSAQSLAAPACFGLS